MDRVDAMKEKIMADYPRLTKDDTFSFSCHPGVPCFNSCCGDVNIFITPYDIIRLKNHLGMTSTEFLKKYTVKPFTKEQALPVVLLKMHDDVEGKPCQFVSEKGCTVYDHRPWPCRMYPVGVASARTEADPDAPEFYFLMSEDPCDGFKEKGEWTIRSWMKNQGVADYDAMGDLFREISLHPWFRKGGSLNPQQMEMYFLACYDIDRFRSFVFESKFLDKYDVPDDRVEAIRDDDVELLKFAFDWLKTCLFRENVVPLKQSTLDEYKKKLAEQGKRVE